MKTMLKFHTATTILTLALAISCSDGGKSDDPTPNTDDPTPSQPVDPKQQAHDKLMADDSTLVITGDALNITDTSAIIPFRINSDPQTFQHAHIAIVYSDFPDLELNYGEGCQEFYVSETNFDRFGIAYITIDGLIPSTKYRYRAYFYFNDKTCAYGEELTFTTPSPDIFTAEPVDLGLSVKWASANLGATRPYQSGVYYHYGDTTRSAKATSLSNLPQSDIYATEHDPAVAELPEGWQSPTRAQMLELINNCTWVKGENHGYQGYYVYGIGKLQQHYIFIPFAGYLNAAGQLSQDQKGFMIWAGEQGDDTSKAYCMQLTADNATTGSVARTNKMWRLPIRPVLK